MPGIAAARAIELLERSLGDLPAGTAHAGVASGTNRQVEDLIAEADDALASARHNGVLASGRAEAAVRPKGATRSVLLADDDPDVMRIVDAHMRGLGFTTTVVFDGQAAINALGAEPDVVVLDLMMPKMTGFEVLQRLSELGPRRPKAIVLSARGREDDVTRAFDLGADDYMVKPFSPQELGARIGRLLR
jgi:CheY-like chemotaxis protein